MREDTAARHPELEALPAAYTAWREGVLGRFTDQLEQHLIFERIIELTGFALLDTETFLDWRTRGRHRQAIK